MTGDRLQSCIDTIIARGSLRLSDAEREILQTAPANHETALKFRAADANLRGARHDALELSNQIMALNPSRENTANHITVLRRAGRFAEALAILSRPDVPLPAVQVASWRCEVCAQMGDFDNARVFGANALALKDTAAGPSSEHATCNRPLTEAPLGSAVISFSLWGADNRYVEGALRNAIVVRYLYPGWVPRFYVDASVPEQVLVGLEREGAQIIHAPTDKPAAHWGLLWRFLAIDDPKVTHFLVRDADSVVNWREARAVQAWLDSGKAFHIMRDWPTHCELMLAGMWGGHAGNLPNVEDMIVTHLAANSHILGNRATDQEFLAKSIWPFVRDRHLAHDRVFGWGQPFPAGTELPGNMHVGQNDTANRARRDVAYRAAPDRATQGSS